jgi:hypothetical protein
MRSTLLCLALATVNSVVCLAQKWEIGGVGGYGWYVNPSISTPSASAEAGFPPRAALGVVFGNNMYEHLGGEFRYLYRFGGPELKFGDTHTGMTGYSNLITYDLVIHATPGEAKLRPFVAGGAGIRVFTSTNFPPPNSFLSDFALLRPHTQVQPAISAGGGVKYRLAKHAQVRLDFRTYFSPLPDDIFLKHPSSRIRGWVYDFVPLAGISYVF